MGNVQLLDIADLAQTGDLAVDLLKVAGGLELAQPGVVIGTGHVVVGMVTGHDHQRTEYDLGVTGSLDSLDDVLAGSLLGLTLDGADEHIIVAQRAHGGLIWE